MKPSFPTKCNRVPVATQERPMLPVLKGISGLTSTMFNIMYKNGWYLTLCAQHPKSYGVSLSRLATRKTLLNVPCPLFFPTDK